MLDSWKNKNKLSTKQKNELIKIRAEIKEIKKQVTGKIKTLKCFFEKIDTTDKSLTQMIKQKIEKT